MAAGMAVGLGAGGAAMERLDMPPDTNSHCAMGANASGEQQYSLRWNDFHSAMVSSFRRLRDEEDFVDVTLACAGATFTAHKVVLSACSPYFRRLLKANPCQHPIVILRDVHDKDMESLLRFMYQGEVHIGQEQLKEFLRAAQLLQVRGLTDVQGGAGGAPVGGDRGGVPPDTSPSASSWTESGSGGSREPGREGRRARRHDDAGAHTPPPKRARSSDLYQAQLKTRTEQLLAATGGSPERSNGGLEGGLGGAGGLSGDESASDAASDADEPRAKQEPLDYDDLAAPNGAMNHGFPNILNLPGFPGLPGPSGIPDNFGAAAGGPWGAGGAAAPVGAGQPWADPGGCRRAAELLRVRATDPRPCPKCGKIYRSAHTLRTHLEDKHTVCPGYRCVLCGTVAKSRNSLHSHMSRQHRGISTKDLPVLQMPTRFDPELASQLLAKAGVKVSPEQLRARASPTGGGAGRRPELRLDAKSAASETSSLADDTDDTQPRHDLHSPPQLNNLASTTITRVPALRGTGEDRGGGGGGGSMPTSAILDTYLQYIGENVFGMSAAKLAAMGALGGGMGVGVGVGVGVGAMGGGRYEEQPLDLGGVRGEGRAPPSPPEEPRGGRAAT